MMLIQLIALCFEEHDDHYASTFSLKKFLTWNKVKAIVNYIVCYFKQARAH